MFEWRVTDVPMMPTWHTDYEKHIWTDLGMILIRCDAHTGKWFTVYYEGMGRS